MLLPDIFILAFWTAGSAEESHLRSVREQESTEASDNTEGTETSTLTETASGTETTETPIE